MKDEDDPVRLRRGAIIKAECLAILEKNEEARAFMQQVFTFQEHPVLYLSTLIVFPAFPLHQLQQGISRDVPEM